MGKNDGLQAGDCEHNSDRHTNSATIEWGNENDRLDMERLGQRQQLSVCTLQEVIG